MSDRFSKGAILASAALGLALYLLTRARYGVSTPSDLCFSLSSGFLIVGLIRLLSNMKMFASFLWGFRFFKRIFRNEAKTGREETEDYAAYRERMGGHRDVPILLIAAVALFILSVLIA